MSPLFKIRTFTVYHDEFISHYIYFYDKREKVTNKLKIIRAGEVEKHK